MSHACGLCRDAEFIRSVWQRYDALDTDDDTSCAPGARVFTLFVATLERLVTSRSSLLGVSAQIQVVGVPTSDLIPYSHSRAAERWRQQQV